MLLGGEVQNVGAFSKHTELAQEFLEDTFFSVDGELTLLDTFGSIPGRADAAATPKIGDDPILERLRRHRAEAGTSFAEPRGAVEERQRRQRPWWATTGAAQSPTTVRRMSSPTTSSTQLIPLLKG